MSDNNKENHPFDEETLRQALSESLQPASAERSNPGEDESATPLFDRDAPSEDTEGDEFGSFDTDDELNYGDLAESWQEPEVEGQEEYLPEDEDESDMEQPYAEPIRAYPETSDRVTSSAVQPTADTPDKNTNTDSAGLSRIVIGVIVLCAVGFTAANWMTSRKVETLTDRMEAMETKLNTLTQRVNQAPAENDREATASIQSVDTTLAQLTATIMENREAIDALKQTAEASATSSGGAPKPEILAAAPAETAVPVKKDQASKETVQQPRQQAQPAAKPAPGKTASGWTVVLMSLKNEAMADEELAALLGKGVRVEKHTVQVKGETYHQLRAGQFEQKDAAIAYSKEVAGSLGYKEAWVSRQ